MGKYFTFVDRFLPIEFFEQDPVKITLQIGDTTDQKLVEMGRKIDASTTFEDGKAALAEVIGAENLDAILARAENPDQLALLEITYYVLQAYREGKAKNLETAKAGRKRK